MQNQRRLAIAQSKSEIQQIEQIFWWFILLLGSKASFDIQNQQRLKMYSYSNSEPHNYSNNYKYYHEAYWIHNV